MTLVRRSCAAPVIRKRASSQRSLTKRQCNVTIDYQFRLIVVFDFPPEKDTMKFFTRARAGVIPSPSMIR